MQSRREMLKRSAGVAGLLAGLGLLPEAAQAAFNAAAFEAKSMADLVKDQLAAWSRTMRAAGIEKE